MGSMYYPKLYASSLTIEPVHACIIDRDVPLTPLIRSRLAACLDWQPDPSASPCHGNYRPFSTPGISNSDETQIRADKASLFREERSELSGNVEIIQSTQIVNAQTAYIYHDQKTNKVTRIELVGDVLYREPDKRIVANKATINPQDKSGIVENAIYRFSTQRVHAVLPAWGRASLIQKFPNQDILLQKATYTTCAPQDKAWQIEAKQIDLNHAKAEGIAKHAVLRVGDIPVLYTPYLSFPTSKDRKSGFLIPTIGYTSLGGYDMAIPYYLNLAPALDATLVPHIYSERGLMMGGDLRFLTPHSSGTLGGNFLQRDRAFNQFLLSNQNQYPSLSELSTNRWSMFVHESTHFTDNLQMNINVQRVSDAYYLQDFSTNLAVLTENQILRQADLVYSTEHWLVNGMVQSYQTLHPINQVPISDIYERLPQLRAYGTYNELPLGANLAITGEFDNYHWPTRNVLTAPLEGPRYHLNPRLSFPQAASWGYLTPGVEVVENYYNLLEHNGSLGAHFNRTIPRYDVDSGLFFDRSTSLGGNAFTQTLEPRLYYLNVPYSNQTQIPVFDSAYMIFNTDQLFRTNRFSGIDRIGDANQLAYAVKTRWLSEKTGSEKASFMVGQIYYFANRRVLLCQSPTGSCVESPLGVGYLSTTAKVSPIASRATYRLNANWSLIGDYVWDSSTRNTNNADLNFHYQPEINHIVHFGYSYLDNGNLTKSAYSLVQDNALHQATVSYAWPMFGNWSSLGVYSYNISKRYDMLAFLGLQYDTCCWAVRLLGGHTFQTLSANATPEYSKSIFLQIIFKGLGSVANSDPASTIQTYIPGYSDPFH